jgi:hypothetical protein
MNSPSSPAAPSDARPAHDNDSAPISGPSFLGLADAPAESDVSYLYDDDPPSSRGRVVLALLILAAFAGFLAYEWKQLPSWYSVIVQPRSAAAAPAPPHPALPAPLADASTPATTANSTNPTTPPPTQKDAAPTDAAQAPSAKPSDSTPPAEHTEADAADDADASASAAAAPPEPEKPSPVKREEPPVQQVRGQELVSKGQAYLYGRGVPQSCSVAVDYLRRAADASNPKAYSQLGGMYATGHCVPLDRAMAYEWFTRAKDAGEHNVWIDQSRQMLWAQMTPGERQRAVREHLY